MGLYSGGLIYGPTFALRFWWAYIRGGGGAYIRRVLRYLRRTLQVDGGSSKENLFVQTSLLMNVMYIVFP